MISCDLRGEVPQPLLTVLSEETNACIVNIEGHMSPASAEIYTHASHSHLNTLIQIHK